MASWQDLVFTVGAIVFFASLLPTALGSAKPPVLTSLPTGVLLLLFSVTYASLGLTVSAVVTVPSGLLWLLIAAQGLAARRRRRIDLNRRPTEGNPGQGTGDPEKRGRSPTLSHPTAQVIAVMRQTELVCLRSILQAARLPPTVTRAAVPDTSGSPTVKA